MDFFDVVRQRRSIRKYTATPVPPQVIEKALDAALLAPNSSNLQTTEFYWAKSQKLKSILIEACLNQGAAATAAELIVVVADRSLWKKHAKAVLAAQGGAKALPRVLNYYGRLIPFIYGWAWLWPLNLLLFTLIGLFRPMMRRPSSSRDLDEVAIKSAALASQNFMNAITASGFDTCPMEGFDEARVKRGLRLNWTSRIVMVISIGKREESGVWGPRYRVPKEWVVKEV